MKSFLSPAKINLFLRVIGRRQDGYHELASLFQAVDLYDTLHVTLSESDSLTSSDPGLPLDGRNLVSKAVTLFREIVKIPFSVKIHLEKRIPQEAGLGGGSSNAATTLWALNSLLGTPLSLDALKDAAAEIGSDVPFFLSQGTAYCTGRGEVVENLSPLNVYGTATLVKPSFGIPTKDVYGVLKPETLPQRDPLKSLQSWLAKISKFETRSVYNDLEGPVFALLPRMKAIKERLLTLGYGTVLMSGSGSAFFCFGDGNVTAEPHLESFSVTFTNRLEGAWYGTTVQGH